jgi:hypothetical protein
MQKRHAAIVTYREQKSYWKNLQKQKNKQPDGGLLSVRDFLYVHAGIGS